MTSNKKTFFIFAFLQLILLNFLLDYPLVDHGKEKARASAIKLSKESLSSYTFSASSSNDTKTTKRLSLFDNAVFTLNSEIIFFSYQIISAEVFIKTPHTKNFTQSATARAPPKIS